MTSPLQKSPLGLLGAFDLKAVGRSPTVFSDTVVPVTDVTDMYLASPPQVRGVVVSGNVTDPTDFLEIVVPAGEAWRLWGAFASITVPASTALPDGIGLGLRVGACTVATATRDVFVAPTADLSFQVPFAAPRPWLLRPLDSLQLVVDRTMGGACAATLRAFRDVLPV